MYVCMYKLISLILLLVLEILVEYTASPHTVATHRCHTPSFTLHTSHSTLHTPHQDSCMLQSKFQRQQIVHLHHTWHGGRQIDVARFIQFTVFFSWFDPTKTHGPVRVSSGPQPSSPRNVWILVRYNNAHFLFSTVHVRRQTFVGVDGMVSIIQGFHPIIIHLQVPRVACWRHGINHLERKQRTRRDEGELVSEKKMMEPIAVVQRKTLTNA